MKTYAAKISNALIKKEYGIHVFVEKAKKIEYDIPFVSVLTL
jgi:hypothetical protein